eukprot:7874033-Pyramimonas_sp.AAC.1
MQARLRALEVPARTSAYGPGGISGGGGSSVPDPESAGRTHVPERRFRGSGGGSAVQAQAINRGASPEGVWQQETQPRARQKAAARRCMDIT